jgi:hypothetical protein
MIQIIRNAALLLVVTAAACAGAPQVRMSVTERMPAAEGTVTVGEAENDNTALEVSVRHLAPPEKIAPEATTYVVWARASAADRVQNLGALKVNDDLRGTLKTVTPLRTFDVFITAEASPTAQSPSSDGLLTASVER